MYVNITEKHSSWAYIISAQVSSMIKPNTLYTIFIGRYKNISTIGFKTGNASIIGSQDIHTSTNDIYI